MKSKKRIKKSIVKATKISSIIIVVIVLIILAFIRVTQMEDITNEKDKARQTPNAQETKSYNQVEWEG